ncbi:hypothetical protein PR202_gb07837 [Eleusine coracana subsp. coracana]|uniref:CTLH domain-containing protein n=1 Tax=Eleusine coracana subsp. coracana TaxID=191504 RepID=A0AAV5ED47_ELECO|nr:hypothetical protein PR202_gb07837 [Eleusine coracana subsp. coracana]
MRINISHRIFATRTQSASPSPTTDFNPGARQSASPFSPSSPAATASPAMDSAPPPPNSPPPVNWEALDALVLDLVRSDRLVLPSPPPSPSPPSSPSSSSTTTATSASSSDSSTSSSASYRSRQLIRHSRRALEAGDVDAALALLRAHAPAALRDHRLLFHLHKQRFVELVRRGTEADREAALDCLRTALAPYALDAYPEAYEEFKHIMLVLIYDEDDQSSPVVNENASADNGGNNHLILSRGCTGRSNPPAYAVRLVLRRPHPRSPPLHCVLRPRWQLLSAAASALVSLTSPLLLYGAAEQPAPTSSSPARCRSAHAQRRLDGARRCRGGRRREAAGGRSLTSLLLPWREGSSPLSSHGAAPAPDGSLTS